MSIVTILEEEKYRLREVFCKYTRKAFQILPKLDKPRILDIGCGLGGPTLELVRLSQVEIIGIDIHQPSLDILNRKIEQAGLSNRVKFRNYSIFNIDFTDESSDIIWSEGFVNQRNNLLSTLHNYVLPK